MTSANKKINYDTVFIYKVLIVAEEFEAHPIEVDEEPSNKNCNRKE
jgi:hypothetical protein